MHADRVIPDGYSGKLAKITIQNPQDWRPFVYFATVLHEDSINLYARMGRNEIFFRKQHISSIEFPKHSEGELSKSDPVTTETDREAKVIYKTTDEQTKVAFGKLSVSESYNYIKLLDGSEIVVPKDKVVSISYSKPDVPGKGGDWTDRKAPRRKRANKFSYARLWKNYNVTEVDKN